MSHQPIHANSWKRHYEQHPTKDQSNFKLADIAGILGYNKSIVDGVAEFCNSDDLCGPSIAPIQKRDVLDTSDQDTRRLLS
jgi:hypothetical protein